MDMKTGDYEHIILSDHEVLKQEFYIKSSKGKGSSRELVLLTNKRIYFYGKEKGVFMRKMVSRFLNLNAIFAGSRSRGRYPILLLIAIVLFVFSFLNYGLFYTNMASGFEDPLLTYIGVGLGLVFFLAYVFFTEKIITLDYPGDSLVIHCSHMKEKDINRMFRLISSAIDQS
jgi:hypothetical protein